MLKYEFSCCGVCLAPLSVTGIVKLLRKMLVYIELVGLFAGKMLC